MTAAVVKLITSAPKKGPSVAPPPRIAMKQTRAIVESDDEDTLASSRPTQPSRAVPVTKVAVVSDDDDFMVEDDEDEDEDASEEDNDLEDDDYDKNRRQRRRANLIDDDVDEEEYEEDGDDDDDDGEDGSDEDDENDDFGHRSREPARMTARQMAKDQGFEIEPLMSLPYTMSKKAQEREEQRKARAGERAAGIRRPASSFPNRRTMKEVNKVLDQLLRRDFAPKEETPTLAGESSAPSLAQTAPGPTQVAAQQQVEVVEQARKQTTSLLQSSEPLKKDYIRWISTPQGGYVTFDSAIKVSHLVDQWGVLAQQ